VIEGGRRVPRGKKAEQHTDAPERYDEAPQQGAKPDEIPHGHAPYQSDEDREIRAKHAGLQSEEQ
jgi:hypothetical protein